MRIKRTAKNKIKIVEMTLYDYRIIKKHLTNITLFPVILDTEDCIYRLVLIELYKEGKFNVKEDPLTNENGYVSITLKPSQAKALSIVPSTIKNLGDYQPYIDDFFPFLSAELGDSLLKIPNISKKPLPYDSGRLKASESTEFLRLEENGIHE